MQRTKKEISILKNELKNAEKAEAKFIKKSSRESDEGFISSKVREKIPEKAMSALEAAFEKGFTWIYTKGDSIIEKTGSIERARNMYARYAASLDRMIYQDTIDAIHKNAGSKILMSKGLTTAEGSAMGVFGIGMPDIPVFLAMLLKTCYEVAAGYGIDYRHPEEKVYTLSLLNTAFSRGEEKINFSYECDDIGMKIDDGIAIDTEIKEEEIEVVSNVLATDMLVAKFIQGLTFVGVVGGPLNYRLLHKMSKVAKIKYRKRFAYRLLLDAENQSEF